MDEKNTQIAVDFPGPLPERTSDDLGSQTEDVQGEAPASTPLFEKFRNAATGALGRLQESVQGKRGRGRPKNCVQCGLPETRCVCEKVGSLAEPSNGPGNDAPDFEAEIVAMVTQEVIKGGCDYGNSLIRKCCEKLNDEPWGEQLVKELTPDKDRLEKIGQLTHIVLKKYNVNAKYLPEAALGVTVLRIGVSYALTLRTLRTVLEKKYKIVPMGKAQ